VAADQKRRLEKTVADLQARFGPRAIGKSKAPVIDAIPTGFPALDAALGIGGLPRGRLSEIVGSPTSGMATMALKLIAQAGAAVEPRTAVGTSARPAAYLDLERTFDPAYAARCGVDLSRLVLVRPYTVRQALAMLPDFALNGGFSVVVVDCPLRLLAGPERMEALSSTLGRLVAPLARSGCALVFLTGLPPGSPPSFDAYANDPAMGPAPAPTPLPHFASVRLVIRRERWLYRRRDVEGYAAQVLVAKNRLAAEGRMVDVAIMFKEEEERIARG
jgi:recombination protein RecA